MITDYLKYTGILALRCALNVLNIFSIRNNRIVFYSFNGKQYSCNPRRISEYLGSSAPGQYELIWAFKHPEDMKKELPAGVRAVKYRSLKYYYLAKTAKAVIFNVQGYGELARRKGQTFIQTWHASNGYKKVGVYLQGIKRKLNLLGIATDILRGYATLGNKEKCKEFLSGLGLHYLNYFNPIVTDGELDDVSQIPDLIKEVDKHRDEFAKVWEEWLNA